MVGGVWVGREGQMVANASVLVVHAGSGMSADSGLPTYTELVEAGVPYARLCSESVMVSAPDEFWAFWSESVIEYGRARPHNGYNILRRWREERFTSHGAFFVVTTNVDGHFTKAGVVDDDHLREMHGRVTRWQCSRPCGGAGARWEVDDRDVSSLPRACAECGAAGRPAIRMFDDRGWLDDEAQDERHHSWWDAVDDLLETSETAKVVILEIGAGITVAKLRGMTEILAAQNPGQVQVVRINPAYPLRDSDDDTRGFVSIATTGLDALERINAWLQKLDES